MTLTLIAFILIYIVAYYIYRIIIAKKNTRKYGVPKIIKSNYKKIDIPLNKINILTRDYYEDRVDGLIQVQSVDSLFENRNLETTHKYISIMTYDNFLYDGKLYSFKSVPIDMSDRQIKDILKNEENITIYFDEGDPMKHYFDLSKLAMSDDYLEN
ncbi:MAG: hypothetical protein ACRDE5_18980 [Ginsengibacter sp.]